MLTINLKFADDVKNARLQDIHLQKGINTYRLNIAGHSVGQSEVTIVIENPELYIREGDTMNFIPCDEIISGELSGSVIYNPTWKCAGLNLNSSNIGDYQVIGSYFLTE